jgi:hypothetical protein
MKTLTILLAAAAFQAILNAQQPAAKNIWDEREIKWRPRQTAGKSSTSGPGRVLKPIRMRL